MDFAQYRSLDATAMAHGIATGEFTAEELVAAAADRLQRVNPIINAAVLDLSGYAPRQIAGGLPSGPLTGVPMVLKDMDGTLAGVPCTMGSRSLADWLPEQNSTLVDRYRSAGAIFVAKTNCPEFGLVGVTEPELHGPTRNPWDTDRTPGGSSGGTAAAIAAGIVPVGHAGDGGGSIRIPASHCGLFGLKPSRGRMPLGPIIGEGWNGLSTPHVISRSVRDSALFLDVGRGADLGAPYPEPAGPRSFVASLDRRLRKQRIRFSRKTQLAGEMAPDNLAAIDDAVQLLTDLGHQVDEVDLDFDRETLLAAYLTISVAAVSHEVAATEQKTGRTPQASQFEAATWFVYRLGQVLTARDLEEALAVRDAFTRSMAQQMEGWDLHLTSTTAVPAVRIGELDMSSVERTGLSGLRRIARLTGSATNPIYRSLLAQLSEQLMAPNPNTETANLTGRAAMSVPLYWNESNVPVGTQIIGSPGGEATLLQLGRQLEEARPWFDRTPQL
ncbi:MAG: amidase [Micrococcales bacterium]|nr:amidase [Micrococcales bacterium]